MKRGRPSSAELSIAATLGPAGITRLRRPDPPTDMGEEQAAIWRALTASRPASWFDGATGLLTQLVRHVHASGRLAALIAQAERAALFDLPAWLALLAAQRAETASIKACSASLRLSPQSIHPTTAARRLADAPPAGPRPWE
jgi:hypothetical protein